MGEGMCAGQLCVTTLETIKTYAANPNASLTLLVVKFSTYPEPVMTCNEEECV